MRHPKANADARRVFCEKITQYEEDGRSIVYIDESGFAHDMPRTHGYAPGGERCHGSHDRQARGRINVIGALLAGVLPGVGLTEANVDADIFNPWLIGDLLPKLPPRVVLVMDRATFHRRADTQAAVAQAGHTLEYLPAYSPDLTKSNINGLKPRPAGGKPGCPSTKYSKPELESKLSRQAIPDAGRHPANTGNRTGDRHSGGTGEKTVPKPGFSFTGGTAWTACAFRGLPPDYYVSACTLIRPTVQFWSAR